MCRSGSHLAMSKSEGVEINRNRGPIIISSQMQKGRQRGQLRRVQNRVGTEYMLHFQHCVLPELGCVQFRRSLYNSILLIVQAGKKAVLLMLDLSNGYGQADREILGWQGDKEPRVRWTIEQPLKLYELLEIYIHTGRCDPAVLHPVGLCARRRDGPFLLRVAVPIVVGTSDERDNRGGSALGQQAVGAVVVFRGYGRHDAVGRDNHGAREGSAQDHGGVEAPQCGERSGQI